MAKTLDEYIANLKDVTEITPEYEIPPEVPTIEHLLAESDKAREAEKKTRREAAAAGLSQVEQTLAEIDCWKNYTALFERRIGYIVGQELPRLTSDKKEVKLYAPAIAQAVADDCMDPHDLKPGIVNIRYLECCRTNYEALRATYKRLTEAGEVEPIRGAALHAIYSVALTFWPGDVWTKEESERFFKAARLIIQQRKDKRVSQQKPPRTSRVTPNKFFQPNSTLHNVLRYGENGRPIITGIPECIETGDKSSEYIVLEANWDEAKAPEIIHRDHLTPIQELVLEGYTNALLAKLPKSEREKLEKIDAGGGELIRSETLRGGNVVTMADIYTAQAPGRRAPVLDSPILKEYEKTTKQLLALGIKLDVTDQFQARGMLPDGATSLTVDEPYIDARTGTMTRGGKEEFVLYPRSIPIDHRYSRAVKQVIEVKPIVLNIQADGPQGWTQCKLDLEKLSIRNYLQKEIQIYRNQKQKHPKSKSNNHNILLFETIWEKSCDDSDTSRTAEHRRREWVEICLIYWQHIGFIDSYEPYKGSAAGGRKPVLGFNIETSGNV